MEGLLSPATIGIAVIVAIVFLILMGILIMFAKFFCKVEQGKAMIVNTMKARPIVTFTGRLVLPVVHKVEVMDISLKRIVIDRSGSDGLICRDNIRADISVNFFVRVNPTEEDVLRVASNIGCERASDQKVLDNLWSAKFAEALKTVGKQMDFEDLYQERENFRDAIKSVIGDDLNGYRLEDVAIDYLEQTPVDNLDSRNILDAQGIRKITELTAVQHVAANLAQNDEKKLITKQNVEAQEAILALERQKADAEAKQKREIETTVAREEASTAQVCEEERLKSVQARIKSDQQIAVEEENKTREVEVAEQERLRVLAIKEEEVTRARELEVVAREKEVAIQQIDKEKAVEQQKREIADVIRERVSVERTVATEEEKIKEVREVSAAERSKQVQVMQAQAIAEEQMVKEVKAAEAAEKAAKFEAQKEIALAEAELESSSKLAESKKVLAEGTQAEQAASGLADARVKEAQAIALEKYGRSEADVEYQKLSARAKGNEEEGMAKVRVQESEAKVIKEKGAAEAFATQQSLEAEASGIKAQGLAAVDVKRAEADAVELQGKADAVAIREKYQAEAKGLTEKFQALNGLDENGRKHEEFRIELEKNKEIQLEGIEAQKVLGEAQSKILADAFHDANINIVGGDGAFFDRFVKAVSLGKSIDGVVNHSETIQNVAGDYVNGDKDLLGDIKEVLTNSKMSSEDIKNLTMSGALAKFMKGGADKDQINALLAKAKEMGLGE